MNKILYQRLITSGLLESKIDGNNEDFLSKLKSVIDDSNLVIQGDKSNEFKFAKVGTYIITFYAINNTFNFPNITFNPRLSNDTKFIKFSSDWLAKPQSTNNVLNNYFNIDAKSYSLFYYNFIVTITDTNNYLIIDNSYMTGVPDKSRYAFVIDVLLT